MLAGAREFVSLSYEIFFFRTVTSRLAQVLLHLRFP